MTVDSRVIPEFPIKREDNNQSTKVDYFLLAEDRSVAFLVEFKTEMDSRNDGQDAYLQHGERARAQPTARGHSDCRRGFESESQVCAPTARTVGSRTSVVALRSRRLCFSEGATRITSRLGEVRAIPSDARVEVVYLQPQDIQSEQSISFRQVAEYLRTQDDALAGTLATYVERWAEPAATRPPND